MVADPHWQDGLLFEKGYLLDEENEVAERVVKPLLKEGWKIKPIRGMISAMPGQDRTTWMGYYAVKVDLTDLVKDQHVVKVAGPISLVTANEALYKMQEWITETTETTALSDAMKIVTQEIKEDAGYRQTWKANIAMAFQDEFERQVETDTNKKGLLHVIANQAADNFLDTLCRDVN